MGFQVFDSTKRVNRIIQSGPKTTNSVIDIPRILQMECLNNKPFRMEFDCIFGTIFFIHRIKNTELHNCLSKTTFVNNFWYRYIIQKCSNCPISSCHRLLSDDNLTEITSLILEYNSATTLQFQIYLNA